MISSFHPHSMCEKVERVTAKTGCTSCTNRTISFKVSGFHPETRLLQRDFIFLNLFELLTFCVFKMHHSKPNHHFSILFYHIACARKLRGLCQKLDALRVQNGQSLSKYQDFIRKLVCYKGISFFKTYLNS